MIYETWTFREKRLFLEEWKEVLKEPDDEKLKLILRELENYSNANHYTAYAEVATALLQHLQFIPPLRKRLLKGSDLSEASLKIILQGKGESV